VAGGVCDQQVTALERSFARRPYVTGKDRAALARTLDLTQTQVKRC